MPVQHRARHRRIKRAIHGRYVKKRVLTAFTAILPANKPTYQLLIMFDEPQPKETYGQIASGWNAVPTAGNVTARIGTLLGIEPRYDLPPAARLILAASTARQ
ncbi:cell division protein FtsI/penicillin-binding protein 2 [Bradyrhizobium sp. USDA 4486]